MEPEIQPSAGNDTIIERPTRSNRTPKPKAEKSILEITYQQKPVAHHNSSSRKPRWALTAWSMAASVIDLLLVFAAACFMGIFVMLLLKIKAMNFSQSPINDYLGFALCFVGLYSGYLLLLRVFIGCSIGEWACGLRLGEPRHRLADDYSLRVLGRFLIVATTGFVILPVLSLFMGQDVAGKLAGLPLVMMPKLVGAGPSGNS